MKIFYIGQLSEGSTSLERMKTLQQLGHKTIPFDILPFARKKFWLNQSIASRFNFGSILTELNSSLIKEVQALDGITHVWVDKGTWIYPETLRYLKEKTKALLFHYTPDPQFFFHRSKHFIDSVPIYDVLITTKEWELDSYKASGAEDVILTYQGYDNRFSPIIPTTEIIDKYASDVCFIGHPERHYSDRFSSFANTEINLRVWGRRWNRYTFFKKDIRPYISGEGLWGNAYLDAISCAKIGLGLLSKWIPETSTTRTFEIPAMGIFLLAERTSIHQQLFEESKEAEFFSSDEEMLEKIQFYLANENARKKIARAGRVRCEQSGYSSSVLLGKVIEKLMLNKVSKK